MTMMVKTHCCFCDKEEEVPFNNATDYICEDCRAFFRAEMSDAVHEAAKAFRRTITENGGENDGSY